MLALSNVTKRFGGVVANDAVTLRVERGSIAGLIGPNGSGKTTLFNAIAGAFPIDAGSIRFKGQEISTLLAGAVARAGIVRTFQQPRVYARLTALDNMLVSRRVRSARLRDLLRSPEARAVKEAKDLLDSVALADKAGTLAGDLSFGQQKLLELAMALANEPELLLLDEPTAGINPALIEGLVARLKSLNKERGLTLLVIEHNMPVVMELAEHIYCLAHGRLLAQGAPTAVRHDPRVIDAYLGAA
jgi:branched-chain amino acid transport system ATP-binding protein